jgi:hypothetical protein
MLISRRQFIPRAILTPVGLRIAWAAGLSGTLIAEGCGTIFNQILNWVPVGEAALNSILAVLTANGVLVSPGLQVYIKFIEDGFNALTAAIKEYQSTVPAPVGALAKIELAFQTVVDYFKTFLASLPISGGTLAIIVGLAQIVFSTIAAFLNQLPPASSLHRKLVIGPVFAVAGGGGVVIPKSRTRRAFKKDWNAMLDTAPQAGVVAPPSARLHIGFFEHF